MPDLRVRLVMDATQYAAGVRQAEKHIAGMQGRVVQGVAKQGAGSMRAASTMFVSAIRDSFASLASGQNPLTIFLQQAPQVAQALTFIGAAALRMAAKWVGLGVGIAAVAGGLYWMVRRLQAAADQLKNFRAMTDYSNLAIDKEIDLLRESAKAHAEQEQWVMRHAKAQNSLGKALDETLEALKEQQKFERDVAESKGATKNELAKMDLDALKEQKKVIQESLDLARDAHKDAKQIQETAFTERTSFRTGGKESEMIKAKGLVGTNAAVVAALEEKVKNEVMYEIDVEASRAAAAAGGTGVVRKGRKATAEDIFTVDVDKKEYKLSLRQAAEALKQSYEKEAELTKDKESLDVALKDATKEAEDYSQAEQSAAEQLRKLDQQITNAEQRGALKEKDVKPGRYTTDVSSLQRIGGMPVGDAVMIDLNKVQIVELQRIRAEIAKNNRGVAF